ncbi:L-serine ammonia-lyase [Psychrobacter sp. LV10R520-6]|uniref:L-serine ammonia-lyase n=1 Tax=Psychrobacter sp. LV10R520-6 TaxID=1415574 RepID=UPI0024C65C26|nr:L-serine ammonia-lyase [Psychrobacter sp. LV10R520-6]SNT69934.1 L-serine ammonia-lyase [Psychrobacter sp. LV10R520-6]
MISVFDLFKIGIGPSSSHTVGPMVAANLFLASLLKQAELSDVKGIEIELYGSLAATGKGHATDTAILLGLIGHAPSTIDTRLTSQYLAPIFSDKQLNISGSHSIDFDTERDIHWYGDTVLPYHPNALTIRARLADDTHYQKTYYSVGGGFVISEENANNPDEDHAAPTIDVIPYPFNSAAELLEQCREHGLSISDLVLANELHYRDQEEVFAYLDAIWESMQDCVTRGCQNSGILPGGLDVKRRAQALHLQLCAERNQPIAKSDKLAAIDWIDLYALAVNEENANGGNVVTAPTNGAAGIIPAVMHYYRDFLSSYNQDGARKFLLNATAIGSLIKQNASISGAEVGCQGEVGSACAMAASALAEILGGDPAKCLNAAEIGIEHNLGLTCDPVGGLVQVPCIERNAMGAVKAVNAARLACRGNGQHFVSFDKVVETMKQTGADMLDSYKETSRGGLAIYADNRIPTATQGVSVKYSQC